MCNLKGFQQVQRFHKSNPADLEQKKNGMSIRTVDTESFSLRAVVNRETNPVPLQLSATGENSAYSFSSVGANVKQSLSNGKTLKFDFTTLQQKAQPTQPTQQLKTPAIFARIGKPAVDAPSSAIPGKLRNAFDAKESGRVEVAKLKGMVEELNLKVKKLTERAAAAESNAQRASQMVLVERQETASKIKASRDELSISHKAEAALRAELSKVQKVATSLVSHEKLQAAVSVAVKADQRYETLEKEVKELRASVSEQNAINEVVTEDLMGTQEKCASLGETHSVLEEKHKAMIASNAALRLVSKAAVEKATAERDTAVAQLSAAVDKLAVVEEEVTTLRAKVEEVSCHHVDRDGEIEVKKKEEEEEEGDPSQVAALEAEKVCPLTLHAGYQNVRGRLLETVKLIATQEDRTSEKGKTHLQKLEARRLELKEEANALKNKYDTIFGAAAQDDDLIEVVAGIKEKTAPPTEIAFAQEVVGEAPDFRCNFGVTLAHEAALRPVVGVPLRTVILDSHEGIGSTYIKPTTFQGVEIGADAEPAPVEMHDAVDSMLQSVVSDLKAFLEHEKKLSIYDQVFNPEKLKPPAPQPEGEGVSGPTCASSSEC